VLAALLFSSAIALTFDDIPGSAIPLVRRCDDAAKLRWNEKLIGTLRRHHAPALGLVVGSNACGDLQPFLNAWLDAGHDLGNHTFSHRDLNSMTVAEYEEDIVRNEPPLREALAKHGKTLRYFRHPFLHTGTSAEIRENLTAFLRDRHYIAAPVTLDSDEFVFAAVYARALRRGDKVLARRVAEAYLPFMESTVAFFERRTQEVIGREIPHILLLHMNALNADKLDALLRMLERRRYRFITVDEALRDPAYALPDGYTGRRGVSWIHRWGLAKGMPIVLEPDVPDWVAREFRATSSSP
jgi:peptidoglycan/xylan/chitin deacetylase (PgdA/CDA1 family)